METSQKLRIGQPEALIPLAEILMNSHTSPSSCGTFRLVETRPPKLTFILRVLLLLHTTYFQFSPDSVVPTIPSLVRLNSAVDGANQKNGQQQQWGAAPPQPPDGLQSNPHEVASGPVTPFTPPARGGPLLPTDLQPHLRRRKSPTVHPSTHHPHY